MTSNEWSQEYSISCLILPRIRHEIDSLVVGAPDLGEMRVMFIRGPQDRFHIIKMVPDHICTGARW